MCVSVSTFPTGVFIGQHVSNRCVFRPARSQAVRVVDRYGPDDGSVYREEIQAEAEHFVDLSQQPFLLVSHDER